MKTTNYWLKSNLLEFTTFILIVTFGCLSNNAAAYEKGGRVEFLTDRPETLRTIFEPDHDRTFAVTFYLPDNYEPVGTDEAGEPTIIRKYPLALFSSREGGDINDYKNFLTDLAGKDVIVAAIEHAYIDGTVQIGQHNKHANPFFDEYKRQWRAQEVEANDASDLLNIVENILKGEELNTFYPYITDGAQFDSFNKVVPGINMEQIVYIGHSLGGNTATLTISGDPATNPFFDARIKAAIDFDGSHFTHPVCDYPYLPVNKTVQNGTCGDLKVGFYKNIDFKETWYQTSKFEWEWWKLIEIKVPGVSLVSQVIEFQKVAADKHYLYLASDRMFAPEEANPTFCNSFLNKFSDKANTPRNYLGYSSWVNALLIQNCFTDWQNPNPKHHIVEIKGSGHNNFTDSWCAPGVIMFNQDACVNDTSVKNDDGFFNNALLEEYNKGFDNTKLAYTVAFIKKYVVCEIDIDFPEVNASDLIDSEVYVGESHVGYNDTCSTPQVD